MRGALDALPANARVRLVSSFSTARFHQGYSDTDAFRDVLARQGQVRNHQHLHAKVYIFDEHSAVITSANLTVAGLRRNWEYGVVLRDTELVGGAIADFEELWDTYEGADISSEVLDTIDEIIADLPTPPRAARVVEEAVLSAQVDEPEMILQEAAGVIASRLTGWKRAVFEVLNEIESDIFTLQDDVYRFVPRLAQQYPDNENIKAKIRQQLQFLRDIGLLKFLGKGRYRKLWT